MAQTVQDDGVGNIPANIVTEEPTKVVSRHEATDNENVAAPSALHAADADVSPTEHSSTAVDMTGMEESHNVDMPNDIDAAQDEHSPLTADDIIDSLQKNRLAGEVDGM